MQGSECRHFTSAGLIVVDVVGCLDGQSCFRYIEIDLHVPAVIEQTRLVGVAKLLHEMDGTEVFQQLPFANFLMSLSENLLEALFVHCF